MDSVDRSSHCCSGHDSNPCCAPQGPRFTNLTLKLVIPTVVAGIITSVLLGLYVTPTSAYIAGGATAGAVGLELLLLRCCCYTPKPHSSNAKKAAAVAVGGGGVFKWDGTYVNGMPKDGAQQGKKPLTVVVGRSSIGGTVTVTDVTHRTDEDQDDEEEEEALEPRPQVTTTAAVSTAAAVNGTGLPSGGAAKTGGADMELDERVHAVWTPPPGSSTVTVETGTVKKPGLDSGRVVHPDGAERTAATDDDTDDPAVGQATQHWHIQFNHDAEEQDKNVSSPLAKLSNTALASPKGANGTKTENDGK